MGSVLSRRSSNKSKVKHEYNWRYAVNFVSEDNVLHEIKDVELTVKFPELLDDTERIEEVTIYKEPLVWLQWTKFLFYHTFVLFKTKTWWWTIEQNSEGITIQRNKNIEAVKYRYRQKERISGIEEVKKGYGKKSIGDLIIWLYCENDLNKDNNYLTKNCKHFAKAVFDYVARYKTY